MRGSSLVHPAVVELLRPYIVVTWNGRDADAMPKDVREVFEAGGFRQRNANIALFALDSRGKVVAARTPNVRPSAFAFDPEKMGQDFKKQLEDMLTAIAVPRNVPIKKTLTLPIVSGTDPLAGARIYLAFGRNNINHFRTPVVEAVATTEKLRAALRYPAQPKSISADDLKPWLEQLYAPAVMDGMGGFKEITGAFAMRPAGDDVKHRYAILSGEASFTLDNRTRTSYKARLTVAVRYDLEREEAIWLRGAGDMQFLRSDPQGRVVETVATKIAIESLPR